MSYMRVHDSADVDDRRLARRVSLDMFFNQYIQDHPVRSLAVNVSEHGLAAQRLVERTTRHARVVAIEFELPGTGEIIWAKGETQFEAIDRDFHRAGIRFLAMARRHERLVREFVWDRRLRALARWRHA
jgi:c-di-GMP-binding flagellar brake protein YcgR